MSTGDIITIILAILSSTALSTFVTSITSKKKTNSESEKLRAEAESIREKTNRENQEYITNQLRQNEEAAKKRIDSLAEKNTALDKKVEDLNMNLSILIGWIMTDNRQYRSWLEDKLKELDPQIEFPYHSDYPEELKELFFVRDKSQKEKND